VAHTLRFIREAVSFAKWEVIGEIEADGAARFAQSLRDLRRSARTIQSYLVALKSFTRWLVQGGKLAADPLAGLKRPSPETDRRHERRALLPEEWHQLEGATRTGKVRYGMEGGERALLYRLAIETGLRAGELRSLTRACLRLDETPPCVVLKARSTKNRKDARQFILPEMAEALREHAATKAPNSPLFKLPHPSNIVRMLRADLAEARRRWLKAAKGDPEERLRREQSDFLSVRDHSGHLLDFHSLRHSTGTWLSQSGVHPKTVQTVMRHGAITLTLDTYGHLFPGQECDAVGQLGHLLAPRLEAAPESMAATGTEGKTAESAQHVAQHLAQQWGGGTGRGPARGGERGEGNEKQTRRVSPCRHDSLATSGEPRRGGAEVSLSGLEPETYGLKVRCSTN
jgi:integrase